MYGRISNKMGDGLGREWDRDRDSRDSPRNRHEGDGQDGQMCVLLHGSVWPEEDGLLSQSRILAGLSRENGVVADCYVQRDGGMHRTNNNDTHPWRAAPNGTGCWRKERCRRAKLTRREQMRDPGAPTMVGPLLATLSIVEQDQMAVLAGACNINVVGSTAKSGPTNHGRPCRGSAVVWD